MSEAKDSIYVTGEAVEQNEFTAQNSAGEFEIRIRSRINLLFFIK
jgi:hypothetical protein